MSTAGAVQENKWFYTPKELPTIGKVGFWGGLTVGALGAFSMGAGVFLGGVVTGWHELAIGLISGGGAVALVGAGGGKALIAYGNWKRKPRFTEFTIQIAELYVQTHPFTTPTTQF